MDETPAPSDLAGLRVLVVEDDYIMAEDLAAELAGHGAEVLGPASDIDGAMALLAAGPPPDAAVLDINLGGVMVFPLVDALEARRVPLLFATGYDAWSIPERYLRIPRLEKPVDVRRIAEALAGLRRDAGEPRAGG